MIRLMAAIRTTATVVTLLAVVPLLLAAIGGSPLPDRVPTTVQIQTWMDDPMQPQYVAATMKVGAWLIWALLAAAVLAGMGARVRRWRWARLTVYLPGPIQGLAATLLGAATVTTAVGVPQPHAAMPAAAQDTPPPAPQAMVKTATVTAGDQHHQVHSPGRSSPTVTVHRGDTLWDIAADRLGSAHRWKQIYRLNTDRYPQMRGGDHIEPGWTLTLPVRSSPGRRPPRPGTATPATPPGASPTSSPDASRTPTPARTAAAGQPTPPTTPSTGTPGASRPSSPAEQAGTTAARPARTAVAPAVSGSASPASDVERDDPAAGPADGVDLPGGWITLGLGSGVVAAAAMVWRRRRHHYQPTPITTAQLNDPDLLPPLAAMTRLRTSTRRHAPQAPTDKTAPPTVREYRTAVVKPDLPPVGPSGSDLAGVAALPLSTGLGLTGDGALDAARGLLVATLASGSDDDPDAKGRAIIPAATLATLLGAAAVDLGHLGRLTVADSDAEAITQLEEEIIRRSRLTADARAADVQTLRDTDCHAEPLPQLLLITEAPDPVWANRLVTAVRLGHHVDIGAAMIGDWPTGTTLSVAADGTTGNDDTPRLAILDTAATVEMLGMLREAHGDIDAPAHPEPPERPHPPAAALTEPDVVVEPDTRRVDDIATPATATSATASRLPVAVRVLGRPAVLDHDGQSSPGIRSKAIELLVYLAVNRQGADLSDIMEALYPDASMRRASERLSTVVADLRKHIRRAADAEQPRKPRLEPIPNTGSRYHLDPAIVRVDWWTLLDHYEAAATATDDEQRLSHLTAAIEAAGGALAEGVEYDWIDTDREVVRRHRIKLLAHAAALHADTDPHQSWLLLEQACQIDPLSDELARTTMHAAAALGDADAIRHRLTTLREALDTHGLELSDETESLAQQLLYHLSPPPQR